MNENTTQFPEWRELYAAAREWTYDHIHPHEEIERILGLKRSERKRYYDQVCRARDELLVNERLCLVNVPHQGYKVLNPNEVPKVPDRYVERADRATGTAISILVNVRAEEMDDINITVCQNKLDYLTRLKDMTRRTKVDLILKSYDPPKLVVSEARPARTNEEPKEATP